uniref:Uncharacterized protein n=1 Tax=Arundo donax TaxID=35708 RepID=A0A0A8Y2D5_ARUDO
MLKSSQDEYQNFLRINCRGISCIAGIGVWVSLVVCA